MNKIPIFLEHLFMDKFYYDSTRKTYLCYSDILFLVVFVLIYEELIKSIHYTANLEKNLFLILHVYLFVSIEKFLSRYKDSFYVVLHFFNVNTNNVNYQLYGTDNTLLPYLVHEKISRNHLNNPSHIHC